VTQNHNNFIINVLITNTRTSESLNLLYICLVSYLSIIQEKLRQIKPQLFEKYHVNSIGLFGSVVRTDFKPESDIDIMVDFSQPIGIEFIDLADELEKLLDRKVDLVSKAGIRPKYYRAIEPDILYV
jgi:predicted nucleotidyltransferase